MKEKKSYMRELARKILYLGIIQISQIGRGIHVSPDEGSDERNGRRWRGLLRGPRLRRQTPASPFQGIRPDDFFHHPHDQTLLEAAELAAVSATLVHGAVLVAQTHVLASLLHGPLQRRMHGKPQWGIPTW